MSETIIAIYEGGVLRPLRPLTLPEHSRVQLRLIKSGSGEERERERAIRAMLSTGRVGRLKVNASESRRAREKPPTISGSSLSDTIIMQRRGEL